MENSDQSEASTLRWYELLTGLVRKLESTQDPQVLLDERVGMSSEMQRQFGRLRTNFFTLYNNLKKKKVLAIDHSKSSTNKIHFIAFESVLLFCIGLAIFFWMGPSRGAFWNDVGLVLMMMGGVNIFWCFAEITNLFPKSNTTLPQSDELFHRIFHSGYLSGVLASRSWSRRMFVQPRAASGG